MASSSRQFVYCALISACFLSSQMFLAVAVSGPGISCSLTQPCPSGLVCRGGDCTCPYADLHLFDNSTNNCVTKVPGPCSRDSDCLTSATCVLAPGTSRGHCVCKAGYLPMKGGLCGADLGGACKSNADCYHYMMDYPVSAGCIDFVCSCENFASYEGGNGCKGLHLDPCKGDDYCTENASCRYINEMGMDWTNGEFCVCDSGFEEASDYTCKPKAGTSK